MSIVDARYERLTPSLELLADEAVLAQAWKKSDTYIRRHNWYADILELEQVSLLLPQTLKKWQRQVSTGDHSAASLLRLVPAPKNGKWYFPTKAEAEGGDWRFKVIRNKAGEVVQAEPDLRPLAHVSIREQVLASAVMLCLADAVETLQGNTDPASYGSTAIARRRVCSYGNRLFCDWHEESDGKQHARFRWGNATTYSQFFVDYERFLERPAEVCREALPNLHDERLFVVKLDLNKFYDCVSQSAVVSRLRALYQRYASEFSVPYSAVEAEPFWQAVEKIVSWQWNPSDSAGRSELKLGLPQGLVASGFFANAYMHDFDQMVVAGLHQGLGIPIQINGAPVHARLLDYCRYVDDMRLVVAIPNESAQNLALETLAGDMSSWANMLIGLCFKDAANSLETKKEKSEAVAWEDFAVQGSTSRFMRGVNGQISTAPDPATLLHATGSLDHLLWLADALDDVDENPLALARISLPRADVRDDTVKRFAANRLRQVLRMRRSMADPDLPAEDALTDTEVSERQALEHEMETIARKLIACWSRNPSLASVLRCGLDIFPSTKLLRPVLQALMLKLEPAAPESEREVALFVLADLLRAGAVETGLHRPESYPESADITGYRQELLQAALVLTENEVLPWYLHQQAALFLAVMQYPVTLPSSTELAPYSALHDALCLKPPTVAAPSNALTAGLLVMRITGQRDKLVIWLGNWLQRLTVKEANSLIDDIAMIEAKLLGELHCSWKGKGKAGWVKRLERYLPKGHVQDTSARLKDWPQGKRSLPAIVAHPENPFVQENALLKLAAELLKAEHSSCLDNDGLGLDWLSIDCGDWNKIQHPDTPLTLIVKAPNKIVHPWNEKPSWCSGEMAWAYRLGRLLRSAIIGESDFTTRFFPVREEQLDRYRGLQSSWYKRRMGLMPLSRSLGKEPTPISPWFNELVMRLLQWPGLEINRADVEGFAEVRQPSDLLQLVKARLARQSLLYGRQSNLPAYLLPVECSSKSNLREFKVALVQTLMPRDSDFSNGDPLMWTDSYRARHRAHLAAMCRLLGQQLAASHFAKRKTSAQQKHQLDLIVFPELAVHPDDMWLLHRLSDSTGALIFAGQTFVEHPYLKKPINRAVWLLRQESAAGRQIIRAYQGKQHGIPWELTSGVAGHRPYQVIVQLKDKSGAKAHLTGAVCYDATDLKLSADMRDVSDGFVIAALNRDIGTFDTMTTALQFHMYQPVMLANSGQFGGSSAQAPFKAHHERRIAHVHGNNQAVISIFEVDLLAFKNRHKMVPPKEKKAAPAGFNGRNSEAAS